MPEIVTVDATMVMLPGGALLGDRVDRSVSMNKKSFGDEAQVNALLAPGVPLTRVIFKLNNVPEPERGVNPSLEKAEIRTVLIAPLPGMTLPETFQLFEVRPAGETGGTWKVTTVESKVKSP